MGSTYLILGLILLLMAEWQPFWVSNTVCCILLTFINIHSVAHLCCCILSMCTVWNTEVPCSESQ